MKNIGILLSGRGSNFEAIAKNVASGKIPNARVSVAISNVANAGGLDVARRMGITAVVVPSKGKEREAHDREMVTVLREHKVDLICFAAARIPRLGSATAGVCVWCEGCRLHGPFRRRRTRSWRHCCAEGRAGDRRR